jgi:predicted DsbA family dithiol-disulfide isomerase
VGKRHLEQAIRDSGVQCDVRWLPFFLDPNTPPEGEDFFEHLAAKYGRGMAEKFVAPG